MLVFFLPNGIGDTLMAIPALRRLVAIRGAGHVAVVVSNRVHTALLHRFVDPALRTFERHDGGRFSQARLWLRLRRLRAEAIVAPMLSRSPLHVAFFATLFTPVWVPQSVIAGQLARLRPSRLTLERFDGHQVDFFVRFLAEVEPGIDARRVHADEQALAPSPRSRSLPGPCAAARVAVGVSCGARERHKIPSPEFFARLLNALARRRPLRVIVIGDAADQPLVDRLVSRLDPGIDVERPAGVPIETLIPMLSDCDLGLSGTTGQGHMMAAAGLPMLVLAGVTDPYESGPFAGRAALLRHRYVCGPCYQEAFRHGCGAVACMESLDHAEGAALADRLLADTEFGKDWRQVGHKAGPVPTERLKTIHVRPLSEWVAPKTSSP